MEYAVLIEREPGAATVGAYSPDADIDVYIVRDASATDEELVAAFKAGLDSLFESLRESGLPIPRPQHRVAMVEISKSLS